MVFLFYNFVTKIKDKIIFGETNNQICFRIDCKAFYWIGNVYEWSDLNKDGVFVCAQEHAEVPEYDCLLLGSWEPCLTLLPCYEQNPFVCELDTE